MKNFVFGLLIVVVLASPFVLAWLQSPLTEKERDFMSYVHDYAKQRRFSKDDLREFIVESFDQVVAEYAVSGTVVSSDPRLIKKIVKAYKPA